MGVPDRERSLYTNAQSRAIDQAAIAGGTSGGELMERAAAGALAALRRRWPAACTLCVVCGPGNNGGDGFLLGALALAAGLGVEAIATGAPASGDAGAARARFLDAGGRITQVPAPLPDADVYVDALFGSGLNRAPSDAAAHLIGAVNQAGRPVLALDVPSGLDGDTGRAFPACIRAAATVCFGVWKRGLFTAEGPDHCGQAELVTLDLAASDTTAAPDAVLLAPQALAARTRDSHKGRYGHVLAVGGDLGTGGAVRLCGEAALRAGAGLVSVATREAHVVAMLAARPELMPQGVHVARNLEPMLARATVVALGPGLGQEEWGRGLWQLALAAGKPTVLDADGLNLLAVAPRALPEQTVLTPHPGEASRLLGVSTAEVQHDRFAAARTLASNHRAVVVLKGVGSLIADPDGRVAVCPWGNPGMASGGTGDVLTGVIAGLLAQHLSPWDAACFGAGLHARAGDLAARAGQRGLVASDLFVYLRALVNGRGGGPAGTNGAGSAGAG